MLKQWSVSRSENIELDFALELVSSILRYARVRQRDTGSADCASPELTAANRISPHERAGSVYRIGGPGHPP
jgi:hypothetical protein